MASISAVEGVLLPPLDVSSTQNAGLSARRVDQLVWCLVAIGVAARLVRYLLRFPLWGDEYMVAENFITRDYAGLMRPLDNGQVAPILYLWLEMAAVKLLGFSEYSLRLVAIVSSVASVFVFRHLARRLLAGVPLLLAVGIFCVSYYPVRHGSEAKPYATDLLVACTLLALAVEWWRDPSRSRWLWVLAAAAPLCVGLSFPSVFVGGGITLGLLTTVWRHRTRGNLSAFIAYNLALVGAFGFVHWLSSSEQYSRWSGPMIAMWGENFPPSVTQPWELCKWFVDAHTAELFAYPIGGKRGGSTISLLLAIVACAALWRTRARPLVLVFLATQSLALVGAALERYPYGGGDRLLQYAGPAICLLVGYGAAVTLGSVRWPAWRRRWIVAAPAVLCTIGGAMIVRDLVQPYKHRQDLQHQGFARWFWSQEPADGELVCVASEQGMELYPAFDDSAFRCYQKIYSPRHRRNVASAALTTTSEPLRCVVFHAPGAAPDELALAAWREQMARDYDLAGLTTYPVLIEQKKDQKWYMNYDVYTFRPKASSTAAAGSASTPR